MLTIALITLLSQTEVPAADAPAATSAAASAERAASAAERAAVAAQKAAEAVAKLMEAQSAAAAAPVVVAVVVEEPKKDPWTGMVGLGLIAISGNSQTVTGTLNAQLDKKFGEWAFG